MSFESVLRKKLEKENEQLKELLREATEILARNYHECNWENTRVFINKPEVKAIMESE